MLNPQHLQHSNSILTQNTKFIDLRYLEAAIMHANQPHVEHVVN